MLHNEASFTWRGTKEYVGSWSSDVCALIEQGTGSLPDLIKPSKTGWDTYRIVTRAKLRSTYQEVAVSFGTVPPE